MKIFVVYDSVFGNTEQVAQTIGNALSAKGDVKVMKPGAVSLEQLKDLDLLVVGSPTRAFNATPDLVTWLTAIPEGTLAGIKVAAFDTRIDVKDLFFMFRGIVDKGGYSATIISRMLEEKGGTPIAAPQGFFVKDREGPMKKGELERGAEWATQLLE
jgi:flavodoxin I